MVDVHARYIRTLGARGRARPGHRVPARPTRQLAERQAAGTGLTTPEFAVLLAYTKLDVAADLLASDAPRGPLARPGARAPTSPGAARAVRRRPWPRHPLRREIIATRVTNLLVDRAGTSFLHRLAEETGATIPDLARGHAAAWEIFGLAELWSAVEGLDNLVPAATQVAMMLPIRRLAERASRWLVRHGPKPLDVAATVALFSSGAARLAGLLPTLLSPADRAAAEATANGWIEAGAGQDLAARVAALDGLTPALDVLQVAELDPGAGALVTGLGEPGDDMLADVAAVYFALGEQLELDWLRDRIAALPRDDRWQGLARSALGDDYARERAALTAEVLRGARGTGGVPPTTAAEAAMDRIDVWMVRHQPAVERFLLVIDDIRAGAPPDLATLSVAMRAARALTTSSTGL